MNEIVARTSVPSLLLDPQRFEAAQRAGKMMALSALFPAHLRSKSQEEAVANAVLVMNIADRMREDPLAVAQNIFFIGGKPGWNASYMISRANQSGRFKGPIRWRFEGEGDALRVWAYAKLADAGDDEVDAEASMAMAKAEGWTKNTKYQSMPRQMLQYRSATLLIRLYCPEVMLGYQTVEEIEDVSAAGMKDITPPLDTTEPEPQPETPKDKPKPSTKTTKAKDPAPSPPKREKAADPPEQKGDPSDPGSAAASKSDVEDAEVVEEKPAEQAPSESGGEFDPSTLEEQWESLFLRIVDDFRVCDDHDSVNGLAGLFDEQIEALKAVSEDAYNAIQDEISTAHERADAKAAG